MNKMEKPVFDGEILLCEDNKMNQDIIRDHLARVGLKTVVAQNGMEGVEMFRSRVSDGGKLFDLVFMDIQMPVMDGLEASDEINKMNTGTSIVAMSANAVSADREEYAAHGMVDCLAKPFTSQELWRCLLKHLTPINAGIAGTENPSAESEEKFYKRLARNFISENQNRYEEIVSAVNAGDIKLANRLAHTLKSNAGYLGRTGLQKAAGDVENLLRDGNSLVTPYELATLKAELDVVLNECAVSEAENSDGAAAPPVAVDAREKQVLIHKLEPLLESGNPECLSLIDGLRTMPGSEELVAQMENFNFDEAREILGKLKQRWI
jgi:CheY-like chemotaxis protein